MRVISSILAILVLGVPAVAARSLCVVQNDNANGEGSFLDCITRARASTATTFRITFAPSLQDGVIDISGEGRLLDSINGVQNLVIRGLAGNSPTIIQADPSSSSIQQVAINVGSGVNLDVKRLTVRGGFECVRVTDDEDEKFAASELILDNFHCADAEASGVFFDNAIASVHIRRSSFNNNGFDGVTLEPFAEGNQYEVSLLGVEADGNGNTGIALFGVGPQGTLEITGGRFDGNDNYGVDATDSSLLLVPQIRLATFNNNNEGIDLINAEIGLILGCEFQNNAEYGVGLEQAILGELKRCIINDNGTYGIDLEAGVELGDIVKTSIKGNAEGALLCSESGKRNSAKNDRSSKSDAAAANALPTRGS